MPFSKTTSFMKSIGGTNDKIKSSVGHVVAICNFVSNISIQRYPDQAKNTVYELTIKDPEEQDKENKSDTDEEITPLHYLKPDDSNE